MCGYSSPRIGAPLEESDLAAMPPEKSTFLRDFFETANAEISAAEEREDTQPFSPSPELREKHARVIGEFGGGHYCPVRQLEIIFNFNPPN